MGRVWVVPIWVEEGFRGAFGMFFFDGAQDAGLKARRYKPERRRSDGPSMV